jgi:ankyrin repeat protein
MKTKSFLIILFIILSFYINTRAQQSGSNEIFGAVNQRNSEKVVAIIQENPLAVNSKNESGQTPLSVAVALRDIKIAEMLLKHGALPNVGDNQLRAPIHGANFNGDTVMINLLLEYGAVIDTRAIGGATPLIHSSLNNNFELSKYLIRKGADINIQCNSLTAPLYFAVLTNNLDYLDYLIEKGAEINTPDFLGRTPLFIAVRDGNLKMAEILIQNDALKYQHSDFIGRSLLHLAAIEGHIELVRMLLRNDLKINSPDMAGYTPLDYAIRYGHNTVAEFLISQGGTKNVTYSNSSFAPKAKESRVIKLQNGGWGIETTKSFIILGYSEIGKEPEQISLKNGHIDEELLKLKKKVFVIDPDFRSMNSRYSVNGANSLLKKFCASDNIDFIYSSQLKPAYSQFKNSNMHFADFDNPMVLDGLKLSMHRSYGRNTCFVIEIDGISIVWLTGICNNYLTYNRDASIVQKLKNERLSPDLLFLGSPAGIGPELAHGIRETFIETAILNPKNVMIMGHELLEEKVLYQLTRLKLNTVNIRTAQYPGDAFIIK